jgi:hypothetical protein
LPRPAALIGKAISKTFGDLFDQVHQFTSLCLQEHVTGHVERALWRCPIVFAAVFFVEEGAGQWIGVQALQPR